MMIPNPWKVKRFARGVDGIDAVWKLVYSTIEHEPERKSENYWKHPEETLRDKSGDCEDKVILALAICNLKNIPARMVGGLISSAGDMYGHAWLETRGGRVIEDHLSAWNYYRPMGTYQATSILDVAKFQRWPWYYRLVWKIWLWFIK
jgi:transglutaminase-like putative cysteine protease